MNATITKVRAAVVAASALLSLTAIPTFASAQSAEGIKVHGRWTIDVRNADGSPASHHEFDNALMPTTTTTPGGASALAAVLGKFVKSVSVWTIWLQGTTSLCDEATTVCVINEHVGPGSPGLGELSVEVPTQTSFGTFPQGTIELKGMIQVNHPGPIDKVRTLLRFCRDDACTLNSQFGSTFTLHTLDEAIPVTAGQVIQVKVVISFS